MKHATLSSGVTLCVLATAVAAPSSAQVLHVFPAGPADGKQPSSGLIMDAHGALYGTTAYGGATTGPFPDGTVFKLTPPVSGQRDWTEQQLHAFPTPSYSDADGPNGNLLMDATGALYGTAVSGSPYGSGAVYKLTPPQAGATVWTETILYGFGGVNGIAPQAGVIADQQGNLYGTTQQGGAFGQGVVYKLFPPASGQTEWTEQVLHSFAAYATDGAQPDSQLVMDSAGRLYGTTVIGGAGGSFDYGTVFQLTPPAAGHGAWGETILHSFQGTSDGGEPGATLAMASDGTLYGTLRIGGAIPEHCAGGCGAVFKLTPPVLPATRWVESTVYNFAGPPDGDGPTTGVTLDAAGDLYGTTEYGGTVLPDCKQGCGTLFELSPPADGQGFWRETVYSPPSTQFGIQPQASLLVTRNNRIYGTASAGGPDGGGTVFKLNPAVPRPATP